VPRKNSRTSAVSRSGASRAAKCPPRPNSDQRTTLWALAANGRTVTSVVKTATATGTSDRSRGAHMAGSLKRSY
jgi:hypothetical protein